MTEKERKQLQDWGGRTGYVVEYQPVQGQAPHRDFPNMIPSGHVMLAQQAMNQVDVTSGIGQNAVGRQDSAGESGRLVETRTRESMANLETLFDNKDWSIVLLHIYLIALIQARFTAFRVERLTNDGDPVVFNMQTAHGIINDVTDGEYGIAIEKMTTKHYRDEKFLKILLFAEKTGLIQNPAVLKSAIEAFDGLDDTEKDEWLKAFNVANTEEKLAQMEAEVRAQANEARKVNVLEQKEANRVEAEGNKRRLQEAA
jgi:hypothetical protein